MMFLKFPLGLNKKVKILLILFVSQVYIFPLQSIEGAIDNRSYFYKSYNSNSYSLPKNLIGDTKLIAQSSNSQNNITPITDSNQPSKLTNNQPIWSEGFLIQINLIFFVSFSAIVLLFGVIAIISFLKNSSSSQTATIFVQALERLQVLRIMMAVVMLYSVSMLTLARAIPSEASVPVITAIISFTLGGLVESKRQTDTLNKSSSKGNEKLDDE
jgi:hypothetical protein